MLAYLPMHFPSIYILEYKGLKLGVILGTIFSVVGAWIKCALNNDFKYAIIGQTLMAIGHPFLFNSPSLLSAEWFSDDERVIASMIGYNSSISGNALGFYLPSWFLHDISNISKSKE